MSVPPPNRPSSSARIDTSLCAHLQALIGSTTGDTTGQAGSLFGLLPDTLSIPVDATTLSETSNALNGVDTGSKRKEVIKRFVEVVRWGAKAEGVKRKRTSPPECHTCAEPLTRPFACLTCPFVGCMSMQASSSSSNKQCMNQHLQASSGKCGFAVDSTSGAIFCATCDDLVYSDTFEDLFRLARIRAEEESDKSREQSSIGRGRERGQWTPWKPSPESLYAPKAPCTGLRPLLNLSQTCFLSAILQAFIHNPLLKAYFLSDKHNRHVCPNGSQGGLGIGKPFMGPEGTPSSDRERGCMCCEMDRAFEEFHNHDKAPYGPITMLYAMWHASAELEGYGQQEEDAHSFFLAALDQIHAHAKGQLSSCNCIAHQTFSGALSSSVTCSGCRTTSTTNDPILDIQLDFPANVAEEQVLTLASMLRRFCAEEKVGDHGKGYECSSCGGGQGVVAMRKLTIKKLPPVLSFQLKRFAHNATSTKVETPVKFPSHLNMKPYVESPKSASPGEPGIANGLPDTLYEYDLFAVVTHEGKLDNGHYWADVLNNDEWWHCDDDKVTPTTLKAVQGQNAYMLFYVKRSLAYAAPHSKLLATNGESQGGKYPGKSSGPMGGRIGHPIIGMAV